MPSVRTSAWMPLTTSSAQHSHSLGVSETVSCSTQSFTTSPTMRSSVAASISFALQHSFTMLPKRRRDSLSFTFSHKTCNDFVKNKERDASS